MNNKANSLGLNNTLFTNATGLDNVDNHSNVFDVATILRYTLKNTEFKKIYETRKYTVANGMKLIASIERSSKRLHLNVNYIKGSKTGSFKALIKSVNKKITIIIIFSRIISPNKLYHIKK